jgi:hypothetical protein
MYMYKLVGFHVWRVGAKGAGIYCLVKVLFFLKVKVVNVIRSIVMIVICRDTMYP